MLPKRLQPGDTVGIVAPASPPNQDHLQKGIQRLQDLGLHVKLGKHVSNVHGYLAGTDQDRLDDLHAMFQDPFTAGIICACGGFGTGRIANKIKYDVIADNPKVFVGYSDLTYLHTAIRQQTGLVTFHGPMVASDIGKPGFDALSEKMLTQLFNPSDIIYSEAITPLEVIAEGEATGEVVGGNLTILTSTLGTKYEIDTKGKLLLVEDIGEEPYRVDSMLNQLKLTGKLDDAAGVIVGDFKDAHPTGSRPSLTLDQVLSDYLSTLAKPVLKGFKIGHCSPNITIPLGTKAQLSTRTKTLTIAPGVF